MMWGGVRLELARVVLVPLLHLHVLTAPVLLLLLLLLLCTWPYSRKLLANAYNSFMVVGFTSFLNFTMFVSISGEEHGFTYYL